MPLNGDNIPKAPRQNLPREEVEVFLATLFANVAVRPKPVTLGEGARVVRYLKATAWSTEAGPARRALERLADEVGRMVLHAAPIPLASKPQAMQFLERHAGTYFTHPEFDATLAFVRQSPGPDAARDFFPKPKLASRERAVSGPGTPRIGDDLSERIYAAYHALRRAKCHGARSLVANALNRHGIGTSSRNKVSTVWGADEVWERVKHYENRLKRDPHAAVESLTGCGKTP